MEEPAAIVHRAAITHRPTRRSADLRRAGRAARGIHGHRPPRAVPVSLAGPMDDGVAGDSPPARPPPARREHSPPPLPREPPPRAPPPPPPSPPAAPLPRRASPAA